MKFSQGVDVDVEHCGSLKDKLIVLYCVYCTQETLHNGREFDVPNENEMLVRCVHFVLCPRVGSGSSSTRARRGTLNCVGSHGERERVHTTART
jgi:hypothetical protein